MAATRAGECVSIIGLSGAGKSNLLGFVTHIHSTPAHPLVLIDCNHLPEPTPQALFQYMGQALGTTTPPNSTQTVERLATCQTSQLRSHHTSHGTEPLKNGSQVNKKRRQVKEKKLVL